MRRIALTVLIAVMLVCTLPSLASAWCNGPAKNGVPRNGYGTHDWILDQAIKLAGKRGAWVVRTTALLATDDPDSQHTNAAYHHYVETGTARGAPQMVSDLYHKAIVEYGRGDMTAASKDLGVLSHYYADILQPFHVTRAANAYVSLHSQYEHAVDDHQHTATGVLSWLTKRPVQAMIDIRDKTISAAMFARSLFPSLVSSYKASRSVMKGTPLKVTKLVMSRAVNDLADIICGISSGSGEDTAPASVDMTLSRTSPKQTQDVGAFVTCVDANGQPMNAVGVRFVWHFPSGDVTMLMYTDSNGFASRYQDVDASPIGKPSLVSTFVTVNGITTANDRQYVTTR